MSKNIDINVHHITRVEGHGNILVNAADGKIDKILWEVPEAPRFFEAMVRGRSYEDIQTIVSRICGICSITHSLASTKAVEDAMGLEVTEQADDLRILMHYSEQLQSHSLHVGYLVAPDLFNAPSVVPLVSQAPEAVKLIVGVHRVANEMSDLLAGRTTHPVTLRPGGLTKIPTEKELLELKKVLQDSVDPLVKIAELVLSVAGNFPAFERETEYISLSNPGEYTFYHGDIVSSDGGKEPVSNWEKVANEYVSPHSTAKYTKWHRDSYMVGALARFNNNAEYISPLGAKVAEMFGLEKGNSNPFMNNVAQIAECAHVVESSIGLIDKILSRGLKNEEVDVKPKAGKGHGCVEAPRGILFHSYEFDDKGICLGGNICIPTNQNHSNIQQDFEKFVPENIDKGQEELRQGLEMLVRAYDPCISCSTHYLDVDFV
jgi:coenzyme F420-reducing hydrogenase alpha subunit